MIDTNELKSIRQSATHGPWKPHLVDDTAVVDLDGKVVAQVCGDYDADFAEMEANARLIALAPDMAAELLRLRAENAELRAAGEWRSIETAPKDGTEIDVSGGTYIYDAETYPTDQPFIGVGVCRWDRFHPGWRGEYGSEYDGVFWYKPTHWRHRPSPPQ